MKSSILIPAHFVAILKRRLNMKHKKLTASSAHECQEVQSVSLPREAIQNVNGNSANVITWPHDSETQFEAATSTFEQLENAFIEDVEPTRCGRWYRTLPTTASRSPTNAMWRTNRPKMSPSAARSGRVRTLPTRPRSPYNSFRACRTQGGAGRTNDSSFANRKSRKKGQTSSKMSLLVTLLPLLQETLSLFDDLFKTAENCVAKAGMIVSSVSQRIPSRVVIMLTIVAILKLELLLEYVFWGSILALWLHPPRIFGPPCHIRRLPAVSARMCHVFQGAVNGCTVLLSVLSFHGGVTSLVTWAIFVSVHSAIQFVGLLWMVKLAGISILIVYVQGPDWWHRLRRRSAQTLASVPGIEFYRAEISH